MVGKLPLAVHERWLGFFLSRQGEEKTLDTIFFLEESARIGRFSHATCLDLVSRFEGLAFLIEAALALAPSFSMTIAAIGVEPTSSQATGRALETIGGTEGQFGPNNQLLVEVDLI